MCETDRDHRAATALYGGRNRRRANNGETNGHHHLNGQHEEANNNNTTTTRHHHEDAPYKVNVSIRFLVTGLLASCLLAFCVGRAARIIMLGQVQQVAVSSPSQQQCGTADNTPSLPSILVRNGKRVPQTRYLSKNFDTSMSASSSSWLAASRDADDSGDSSPSLTDTTTMPQDDDDEENQPMAEHLMVDIKHVDPAFLNSERRLATAIIEVMDNANLTLLSYHCHGLVPMGVSCVGVLLKNYISFHTWPEEGVITLDLCVGGGARSLLPVLPILERAFGKPSISANAKKPEMRWAHRVRGFPTVDDDEDERHDLGLYVLGDLATDVKKEIFSVETNFQKLDIYDVKELNNERTSPLQRKSQDSRHAVVMRPDRVVMRDGWVESTLFHEAAYHEALVHPALFAHANPKRVAIIGGGEGATLREALKHKTVEEAVLLEIDETIVNVSKIHMPEWSDCSDLNGSASWCIEDARTKLLHEDALEWFVDRYANEASDAAPIDVVIMNALGAESETDYAEALYSNVTFMQSFYNSLSDDGVLVMQLGESPDSGDPDEMLSGDKNRVAALNLLETVGFESIHAYAESHCGFGAAWTFVVAFKSYTTRRRWYANAAEIELAIRKRIIQTKSGKSPLRYFDGATMVSYQEPSRTIQNVFCRRQPAPVGCGGGDGDDEDDEYYYRFDLETPSVPVSSLEVKASVQGENAGRGVFTTVDIEEDTYIAPETYVQSLRFFPSTYALIMQLREKCEEQSDALGILTYYMFGYGFTNYKFGTEAVFVDSSIITFVNHGCRSTYNVGQASEYDEFSADLKRPSEDLSGRSHVGTSLFNPIIDRHPFFSGDLSIRDIHAGEEILDNYLAFIGSSPNEGQEEWEADVMDLRQQCSGQTTEGSVTAYEDYYKEETDKHSSEEQGEEL